MFILIVGYNKDKYYMSLNKNMQISRGHLIYENGNVFKVMIK